MAATSHVSNESGRGSCGLARFLELIRGLGVSENGRMLEQRAMDHLVRFEKPNTGRDA